jgi:hypothetical protein
MENGESERGRVVREEGKVKRLEGKRGEEE